MLASSFDSDTTDIEPVTRERQSTVVQDAPPLSSWDSVPRNRVRKSLTTDDDSPDKNEVVKSDKNDKSNTFKSDWSNTRTHQSFLVDSVEIERKVNGDSLIQAKPKAETDLLDSHSSSQQLSPYLSLPKQPPTMSIVQEGEFMFQEIDRDGDGVVSKIELIKALKVNSPLAEVLQCRILPLLTLHRNL